MKKSTCSFYLWPILTFIGLLLYKNYVIGYQGIYFLNLVIDSLQILFVFYLSIKRESKSVQHLQIIILIAFIIFHWADTCVFLAIHDRLTYNNFVANYQSYNILPYFITKKLVIFTAIVFITPILLRRKLVHLSLFRSSVNFMIYQVSIVLLVTFFWLHSKSEIANAGEAIDLSNNSFSATSVTADTLETLNNQFKTLTQKIQAYFDGTSWKELSNDSGSKPNLILVISESLSSVDSKYAGGLFNRLPMIDKLQQDGLTFSHAVSNGKITAHGLAASMLAIQTTITGGFKRMLDQFSPKIFPEHNIIAYAKQHGYKTILISPSQPVNFEGMIEWFHTLGFDEVYDIDSPVFKDAPRFTWNAPSDEYMYQFAEKLMPTLQQPYVLMIETVSLHQSYVLPDPKYRLGNNELLNLINYVDGTTYHFYETIKNGGFLSNGYFVLYGDHRRFEPLEQEEVKDGGYAVWHERVICTIIGKGIPSHWISSIPFSLVNLNALLHYIVAGKPVDKDTVLASNLSGQLGTKEPFSTALVDHEHGTYLVRSEKYEPMYISIFGDIPFDKITNDAYKAAVAYLIENNQHIKDKLNESANASADGH